LSGPPRGIFIKQYWGGFTYGGGAPLRRRVLTLCTDSGPILNYLPKFNWVVRAIEIRVSWPIIKRGAPWRFEKKG